MLREAVGQPARRPPYRRHLSLLSLLVSLPTRLARAPLHGLAPLPAANAVPPPPDAMPFLYTTNLSEVRALAESKARVFGLPEDRITDFVIAVAEVAGNTVRHARSAGTMEIWLDGRDLICEIRDAGVITDPFVGRRPPAAEANGGHGLWLVHQICDHEELHSDEKGTVIRLHKALR